MRTYWYKYIHEDRQEGEKCKPKKDPDAFGLYTYDADKKCVLSNCVTGYKLIDDKCNKIGTPSPSSLVCELDPENPYVYGTCLNKSTNQPLSNSPGNCGKGKRSKTPRGGNSSCPDVEYVECEVPCPKQCKAPDELWVPVKGSFCMSGMQRLGDYNSTPVYCGEGWQKKELDETKITEEMMGDMTLDDYKESINWSKCEVSTLTPCKVDCTSTMLSASCPVKSSDLGWSYEGGGKVYTKQSVDELFDGNIDASQLKEIDPVTRQYAIDNGILNIGSGNISYNLMPKGYKIKYKSSNEHSTEYLRKNGCSVFVKEEATAPMTSDDVTYTRSESSCVDVGCAQYQQKDIEYTIKYPAWGSGDDRIPSPTTETCDTRSPSCCDESYAGEWIEVDGYDGCTDDGKRIYRRRGNAHCDQLDEQTKQDNTCNYDCELTSITMSDSKKLGVRPGASGTHYYKTVTDYTVNNHKGTGKECPTTLIGKWAYDSSQLMNILKYRFDKITAEVPSYKCKQKGNLPGIKDINVIGENCGPYGNGSVE